MNDELLWYPTPPVNIIQMPTLRHSEAYLRFKQEQQQHQS